METKDITERLIGWITLKKNCKDSDWPVADIHLKLLSYTQENSKLENAMMVYIDSGFKNPCLSMTDYLFNWVDV